MLVGEEVTLGLQALICILATLDHLMMSSS